MPTASQNERSYLSIDLFYHAVCRSFPATAAESGNTFQEKGKKKPTKPRGAKRHYVIIYSGLTLKSLFKVKYNTQQRTGLFPGNELRLVWPTINVDKQ